MENILEQSLGSYVKVGFLKSDIITYKYLKPVENANVDLAVMKYITSKVKSIVAKNKLKKLKILGDISLYRRLDCLSVAGLDMPSMASRKYVTNIFMKLGFIKAAYVRKNSSNVYLFLLNTVAELIPTKLRLFSIREDAIKWLKS